MKKVSKIFLWLALLNKRMLKKVSFLVLLCCIPLLVVGVNFMAKQESGMLKIVLCREKEEDALAQEIMTSLKTQGNMLQFVEVESTQEARNLVQSGQADAAWIFPKDLQGRIEAYLNGTLEEEGVVIVIEKEDNVALHLSREILFGKLYSAVSYSLYTGYVTGELLEEEITEEELREHYDETAIEDNMFVYSYLDGEEGETGTSYLLFPIRGLLALLIALCGLAMELYFMQDEDKGLFTWMPLNRSVWGSWLYQLPGLLNVGVIVLVALLVCGVFTNWLTELVLMILYMLMVAGFSDVMRRLCGRPSTLGAVIPMLLLIMLALSPIFMGAVDAKAVQVLLPSYYYLNAIHNRTYWLWMLLYVVAVYLLDLLLLGILGRRVKGRKR